MVTVASQEQSLHVFSDANTRNIYDADTFTSSVDSNSIYYAEDGIILNVTYTATRTNRNTGEKNIGSNHRTLFVVWQDGMWQVNDIAFLADSDFAAGRYANLES